MKNKIVILSCLILIVVIGAFAISYFNNVEINEYESYAIYLEQTNGNYLPSNDNVWPDNYIINIEKSYCEYGSQISWDYENNNVLVSSDGSDKCYMYFDYFVLTDYLVNNHTIDNGLIKHTVDNILSAADNNYRYSGSNEIVNNNYVCLGNEENICSEDNVYRILGLYHSNEIYNVKLIKNKALSNLSWDNYLNNYTNSTINAYLNNDFYSSLNSDYHNMIIDNSYNIGTVVDGTAKNIIDLEQINTIVSKVSLMNASDYAYASGASNWNKNVSSYNEFAAENWLYTEISEWTINGNSVNSNAVYSIAIDGNLIESNIDELFSARPVVTLSSDVLLLSGDGTIDNPFRIFQK